MIYRVAGNHFTLCFISLVILLGAAGIMTQQVQFLADNMGMNFIPTEVALEENIAILIAAFGVFLEHRIYLLRKIYPDTIPESVAEFDQYSHNVGVMFIMLAILMEATDLFFLALNSWGFAMSSLKYLEISILFSINVLSAGMFVIFAVRSFKE
ncbi:MAG: hypothetical protein HOB79_04885 [Rhodospirillaceae bacterium]|jgi:hypothetical protein|nr:hypothetical protein [Rhodospirillales bacterium]MBT3905643.1 hypothetical protein [Rhodospirillaceae bacterium]MBT4700389.1 hypothetical protein [Rhodospirillaceae bacterium]MBT5036306.1 hypothetical protein [Rhodospirillaceae bacterium]MBT6219598.1 hypothetical protein [Rhodospirillaceae bacterium]